MMLPASAAVIPRRLKSASITAIRALHFISSSRSTSSAKHGRFHGSIYIRANKMQYNCHLQPHQTNSLTWLCITDNNRVSCLLTAHTVLLFCHKLTASYFVNFTSTFLLFGWSWIVDRRHRTSTKYSPNFGRILSLVRKILVFEIAESLFDFLYRKWHIWLP